MTKSVQNYQELLVWQKGMAIVKSIYGYTHKLPPEELYGLSSQMRRAAISIPSNIAEGRNRSSRKDFVQFLRIASGSLAELETQVLIVEDNYAISKDESRKILELLDEERKMLNSMMKKLRDGDAQKLHSINT